PAQAKILPPDERPSLELDAVEPLDERRERHLSLDARQRRAEAEVRAPAERQVAVIRAAEVQTVGCGGALGGTVAGGHRCDARLALLDPAATQLDVVGRHA